MLDSVFVQVIPAIFIILFLISIRFVKDGYHEECMSLDQCEVYRGVFAILILLHHICQNVFLCNYLVFGFSKIGYIGVVGYFIMSGYGLMKSNLNKEDYSKTFFVRRILLTLLPCLLIGVVYAFLFDYTGGFISFEDLFNKMWNQGWTLISYSWYVVVILLLYFVFFISILIFKQKRVPIIITSLVFSILWCLFGYFKNYGTYWYVSIFTFVLGLVYGAYEEKINNAIRSRYIVNLILSIIAYALFISLGYVFSSHGIHSLVIVINQVFKNISLGIMLIVLIQKMRIKSTFFEIMGVFSYEIYLSQGIFTVYVFKKVIDMHDSLYMLLSIVCTIVFSFIFYIGLEAFHDRNVFRNFKHVDHEKETVKVDLEKRVDYMIDNMDNQ